MNKNINKQVCTLGKYIHCEKNMETSDFHFKEIFM